jgi:hypothetical protein
MAMRPTSTPDLSNNPVAKAAFAGGLLLCKFLQL